MNTGHARLLDGLLPQLFATNGDRTLGAAHLAGLRAVVASGAHLNLVYSFGILGDPHSGEWTDALPSTGIGGVAVGGAWD